MSEIRIDTEHVRQVGGQFRARGRQIDEIGGELRGAMGGLDTWAWDGRSRARAEPMLNRVGGESGALADDLDRLGRMLQRVADTFEHQDNTAAGVVGALPWAVFDVQRRAGAGIEGPLSGNPDFADVDDTGDVTYNTVNGQPFLKGFDADLIDPNDVSQGMLGDCYFMASLAAIAMQNPDIIRDMIEENDDGTYTVTLYKKRNPLFFWQDDFQEQKIVVDADFPTKGGNPYFAQPGDVDGDQNELWPMLVEKAYAKMNGGYEDIEGGWGEEAMEAIAGCEADKVSPSSLDLGELEKHLADGHGITAGTLASPEGKKGVIDKAPFKDGRLVTNHVYYITGVDKTAGTVTVRNPWGWTHGESTLTYAEFQESFGGVSVSPLK
jgi:uncharacterized protein YukE